MFKVEAWVDGSSSGTSDGPGGWGVVLRSNRGHQAEHSGGETVTTNNRMEITAACEALERIKPNNNVTVYSDSAYVVNAVRKGWIKAWRERGWRKSSGDPVANTDLWERLDWALHRHLVITFVHVKGHAGNELNERADELAVAAKKAVAKRADREDPEEVCMRLREEYPRFYIEFARACGLLRYVTYEHTGDKLYAAETAPEDRDEEYIDSIFEAFKTLILIDPDMRR